MSIKRILALTLATAFTMGSLSPVAVIAAQQNGVLAGKATDKVRAPYSRFVVRVRGLNSTGIVQTVPLTAQGQFSVSNLALSQSYLVELFDTSASRIVCTEGPFALGSTASSKMDINIDCGKNPAAWLLAAGAGAALLAAATQSSSQ